MEVELSSTHGKAFGQDVEDMKTRMEKIKEKKNKFKKLYEVSVLKLYFKYAVLLISVRTSGLSV